LVAFVIIALMPLAGCSNDPPISRTSSGGMRDSGGMSHDAKYKLHNQRFQQARIDPDLMLSGRVVDLHAVRDYLRGIQSGWMG